MFSTRKAVYIALATAAPVATADIIDIEGYLAASTEGTGANFGGSIEYTVQSSSSGSLLITIGNESPEELGSYLTGFVFNVDSSDPDAQASLAATSNPYFLNTGNEHAPPFGYFDAGAALGGSWLGGGSPVEGIQAGHSAWFQFDVAAADADTLTAASFISGPNEYNFIVRFLGLDDGGSDKVPVPAPGTAATLAICCALAATRRRR